jgi:hypothetical protein
MQKGSKIFGIGLGRTGTKSLTAALQILGYKIIHYPNDETTLRELMNAQFKFTLLEYLDGITDITVAPYYAQLDRLFPGSKFILTIRDKKSWLRSLKKHWTDELDLSKNERYLIDYKTHLFITKFLKIAVFGCCEFDEERMSYVYDLHHQNVVSYFGDRPEDLLVLNICSGEGWEKLCPFLQQSIHHEPFPFILTEHQLLNDYREQIFVWNMDKIKHYAEEDKTMMTS